MRTIKIMFMFIGVSALASSATSPEREPLSDNGNKPKLSGAFRYVIRPFVLCVSHYMHFDYGSRGGQGVNTVPSALFFSALARPDKPVVSRGTLALCATHLAAHLLGTQYRKLSINDSPFAAE